MKAGILDHHFGAGYANRLRARDGHMPAALTGLREQARAVFGSQGLPGPKREEWRFTPLRALAKVPFVPASHDVAVRVPDNVPVFTDAARIVLVNGVYRRDLSDAAGAGVTIGDLHALSEKGVAPERNILGRLAQAADSPLVALNAAYMTDGLDIHVTGAAEKTLHVISLAAPGDEPSAFHPRVVVVLDPGASLTLIETHAALPGAASFANPVTEISLGAGASLRRYVQVEAAGTDYHLATSAVAMAEAARPKPSISASAPARRSRVRRFPSRCTAPARNSRSPAPMRWVRRATTISPPPSIITPGPAPRTRSSRAWSTISLTASTRAGSTWPATPRRPTRARSTRRCSSRAARRST
jgi:hypothetical protein